MSIRRKLFLSHFLSVLLVSGSIGTYFYMSAVESLMTSLQTRLQFSAALISQAFDARDLDEICQERDIEKPVYQKYLTMLRSFRRTNPDISFLYVMRKDDGRVVFVLDSDESSAQALPGREYANVIPFLMEGFLRPSVDERIYTDEWGSFMSGYAPLRNGEGEYLVGIDMRATEVADKFRKLRLSGILSLVGSIVLALIFSRFLSSHFITPIQMLISRCKAIAEGRLGERLALRTHDELDDLIAAFNTMSAHLEESEDQNRRAEQALKQGRDELEIRVEERTRDLVELNDKLMHEIAERKKAEEALDQAARSDPLTGLLNRRAMLKHLEYQVLLYQRSQTPFAVLLSDVDHFKQINDAHGHDIGDRVLNDVAHRLQCSIRSQDLLARWGGEEFLMLLPGTDLSGGMVVAEKVRRGIGDEVFRAGALELKLTLSIGVTVFSKGQTLNDCIKAADSALYEAKHQGRNRSIAAS